MSEITITDTLIEAIRAGVPESLCIARLVVRDHLGAEHAVDVAHVQTDDGATHYEVIESVVEHVDARAALPRNPHTKVLMHDLASLLSYIKRMAAADDDYIDIENAAAFCSDATTEVVLDYESGGIDWRRHRAVYPHTYSRQWQAWIGASGKAMGQVAFADWIDEHATDIIADDGFADAPTMLAMARNLTIHDKGSVKRSVNPTTGEATLLVSTEHGEASTKIPRAFKIAIPVWKGEPVIYPIECTVHLRLDRNSGAAAFHYQARGTDLVLERALESIRAEVAAVVPAVYRGAAPGSL